MGDPCLENCCPKPNRLVIQDKKTLMYFLIAVDCEVSLFPKSKATKGVKDMQGSDPLVNNNNLLVSTFGKVSCKIDLGLGQNFTWPFYLVNYDKPIIGKDFLSHFGLVLNFSKMCLVNPRTGFESEKISSSSCECHQKRLCTDGWPNVTGILNQPIKHRFHVLEKCSNLTFLLGYASQISIFPKENIGVDEVIEPFNGPLLIVGDSNRVSKILGWTIRTLDFGTGQKFEWKFAVVEGYKPIVGIDFLSKNKLVKQFRKGRFCLYDFNTKLMAFTPTGPCDCGNSFSGWPSIVEVRGRLESTPRNEKSFHNNYKPKVSSKYVNLKSESYNRNAGPSNYKDAQVSRFQRDYKPCEKNVKLSKASDPVMLQEGRKQTFKTENPGGSRANSSVPESSFKHQFHITDNRSKLQFLVSQAVHISAIPKSAVRNKDFKKSAELFKIKDFSRRLVNAFGWTYLTLDFNLGREYGFKFAVADVEKPILGLDFIQYFKFYYNDDSLIDRCTNLKTAPPSEPCDCAKLKPRFPPPKRRNFYSKKYSRTPKNNHAESSHQEENKIQAQSLKEPEKSMSIEHFHVVDKYRAIDIIVTNKISVSVYPVSELREEEVELLQDPLELVDVFENKIKVLGFCNLTMDIGLQRDFVIKFYVIEIDKPMLGLDFLHQYGISVSGEKIDDPLTDMMISTPMICNCLMIPELTSDKLLITFASKETELISLENGKVSENAVEIHGEKLKVRQNPKIDECAEVRQEKLRIGEEDSKKVQNSAEIQLELKMIEKDSKKIKDEDEIHQEKLETCLDSLRIDDDAKILLDFEKLEIGAKKIEDDAEIYQENLDICQDLKKIDNDAEIHQENLDTNQDSKKTDDCAEIHQENLETCQDSKKIDDDAEIHQEKLDTNQDSGAEIHQEKLDTNQDSKKIDDEAEIHLELKLVEKDSKKIDDDAETHQKNLEICQDLIKIDDGAEIHQEKLDTNQDSGAEIHQEKLETCQDSKKIDDDAEIRQEKLDTNQDSKKTDDEAEIHLELKLVEKDLTKIDDAEIHQEKLDTNQDSGAEIHQEKLETCQESKKIDDDAEILLEFISLEIGSRKIDDDAEIHQKNLETCHDSKKIDDDVEIQEKLDANQDSKKIDDKPEIHLELKTLEIDSTKSNDDCEFKQEKSSVKNLETVEKSPIKKLETLEEKPIMKLEETSHEGLEKLEKLEETSHEGLEKLQEFSMEDVQALHLQMMSFMQDSKNIELFKGLAKLIEESDQTDDENSVDMFEEDFQIKQVETDQEIVETIVKDLTKNENFEKNEENLIIFEDSELIQIVTDKEDTRTLESRLEDISNRLDKEESAYKYDIENIQMLKQELEKLEKEFLDSESGDDSSEKLMEESINSSQDGLENLKEDIRPNEQIVDNVEMTEENCNKMEIKVETDQEIEENDETPTHKSENLESKKLKKFHEEDTYDEEGSTKVLDTSDEDFEDSVENHEDKISSRNEELDILEEECCKELFDSESQKDAGNEKSAVVEMDTSEDNFQSSDDSDSYHDTRESDYLDLSDEDSKHEEAIEKDISVKEKISDEDKKPEDFELKKRVIEFIKEELAKNEEESTEEFKTLIEGTELTENLDSEIEKIVTLPESLEKHHFHVVEKNSDLLFIIDTNSKISVFPRSKIDQCELEEVEDSYEIIDSTGAIIPIHGWITKTLDFGLNTEFIWTFAVIDVEKPVISTNFYQFFGIELDFKSETLSYLGVTTSSESCDCEEKLQRNSFRTRRVTKIIKHFHMTDKNSKMLFFLSGDSDVSIFPRSMIQGDTMKDSENLEFIITDSSIFPILGYTNLKLDFELGREYEWSFAVTDFVKPIIGKDFINQFELEIVKSYETEDACDCGYSDFLLISANLKKSDSILDAGQTRKVVEPETCKNDGDCSMEERFILVDQENGKPCLISKFEVSVFPKSDIKETEIQPFDDSFDLVDADGEKVSIHGWSTKKIDFGLGRFFLWKFVVIDIDCPIIAEDFTSHFSLILSDKDGSILDKATSKSASRSKEFCQCQTKKLWPNSLKKVMKNTIDEPELEDPEEKLQETEI